MASVAQLIWIDEGFATSISISIAFDHSQLDFIFICQPTFSFLIVLQAASTLRQTLLALLMLTSLLSSYVSLQIIWLSNYTFILLLKSTIWRVVLVGKSCSIGNLTHFLENKLRQASFAQLQRLVTIIA